MSRGIGGSHRTVSVLVAIACLGPVSASADGGYFSRASLAVSSDQRAILIRNGTETSITLSTAYSGEAEEFGWVIPTPAAVEAGDVRETGLDGEAIFSILEKETAPAIYRRGGGCFPAGTAVLTPQGPRAIEALSEGDRVLAYEKTAARWTIAEVSRRSSLAYEGDLIEIAVGDSAVRTTGNHPFLVLRGGRLIDRPPARDVPPDEREGAGPGRWVNARDLLRGDVLACMAGGEAAVTGVSAREASLVVYNLTVEGCHTYAVHGKGIVVHNKGGAERAPATGVTVHGTVSLGHYEAATLGASSASSLLAWLQANGYPPSPAARDVLDAYIGRGWSFVAVKLKPGERRLYEKEFLPPITMTYNSDQFVFPLRISSVSTAEPARITLFVVSSRTVWSPAWRTRLLRYDPAALESSGDPSRYVADCIRRTIGKDGRGLAVVWKGSFEPKGNRPADRDPRELRVLMKTPFPEGGEIHLTRLETIMDPRAMTSDIELRPDRRARSFQVDNRRPDTPLLAALGLAGLFLLLGLVSVGLPVAAAALNLAGTVLAGPFVLLRHLLRARRAGR